MLKEIEIALSPNEAINHNIVRNKAIRACQLDESDEDIEVKILRRSVDARSKFPLIRLKIIVAFEEKINSESAILENFNDVSEAKNVLIIGAGPAGYFAALELIELGLKPIVLDRGKDVRARRRDLKAIMQYDTVNPHSNYCFGEGGAGTYSDGKLYTRSHKRGSIEKALRLFVEHGATPDILIDAHPHIGSNKLPNVVSNIRESILKYGGEVHFDSFVTDILFKNNKIVGVTLSNEKEFFSDAVILATGHSARDIYELLKRKKIAIESKPFALGVRIEHQQALVDEVQYRQSPRDENLPASSYSLVCQVENRGVFSFCMCPGGLVVPAATEQGEMVVNGMSMSRRDSLFANSGTVVAVETEDLSKNNYSGEFAGLDFQRQVEQKMFAAGDGSLKAPAQRLTDFVEGKMSQNLPNSSYIPGLYEAPLHQLLPNFIYRKLRAGVQQFGKLMKGYYTGESNVIGVESRTSSPIKIPRDKDTLMHPDIDGFFPCGEGAGFAGGIISAAMDGQNVAKAVKKYYN